MVGASRRYDGPMGKSDRAFVFGALGLVDRPRAALPGWAALAMPLLAAALVLTIVNRVRSGLARRRVRMNDAAPASMHAAPVHERTFRTHDGVDLFYRHWPAPAAPARGAIVLFHRGHEHSGRMAHLVDELDLPDFDFFAWDARGHGRSPGERGYAPSFARIGARRADVRRPHRRDARLRDRGHRRDRAERRRGAGRRVGARLRAAHPLHGARLARVQGQALRAVRASRARAHAEAARQLLRATAT